MRNVIRVAVLGGAMMLFAVTPASAVTVVGQTFTPDGTCGQNTFLQFGSPGSQYTVPYDGVITSWSHQAAPDNQPNELRFKVGRFAGADAYTIVGESAPKAPTAGQLNTYPDVSIAVRAGDLIGFYPGAGGPRCVNVIASYSVVWDTGGVDVAAGTTATFTPPQPNIQLDVSATLELDADHDGFGDETEDVCPGEAGAQSGCDADPPETTITQGAPNRTDKTKVKFKFSSDEPGSTFECKIDKKPFKPCTPKTVKRLDEAKHKFKVRAIDAAGNVDPSAAKDKFKVVD